MARRVTPGTGTLVLDSEGLSKTAAGDERAAAYVKKALLEQGRVVVPAIVIAEVLRGGARDAKVHRALKQTNIVDITGGVARAAGEILGDVGSDKTVDAVVAIVAADQGGRVVVLTSDPDDLRLLTEGRGNIAVVRV